MLQMLGKACGEGCLKTKRVERLRKNLLRGTFAHNMAMGHNEHTVGCKRFIHEMCYMNDCNTSVMQAFNDAHD